MPSHSYLTMTVTAGFQSFTRRTRNSSEDEIANVNFLYDDIVHALKIQYTLA